MRRAVFLIAVGVLAGLAADSRAGARRVLGIATVRRIESANTFAIHVVVNPGENADTLAHARYGWGPSLRQPPIEI